MAEYQNVEKPFLDKRKNQVCLPGRCIQLADVYGNDSGRLVDGCNGRVNADFDVTMTKF